MDISSVQRGMESKKKTRRNNKSNSLKVVYISSPMKVKTCASRFRSLVQELTGRHSDVSRYMETNGADADFHEIVCEDDRVLPKSTVDDEHASLISSMDSRESPTTTSSDSFLEPIDSVFSSQMDNQFGGFLPSSLLYDSRQFDDVLGSYI
ncbi:sigma factor binding protein 1, chloroplastic-like [Olea europaea var. sylvestris]|uniref:sigma factor binding protein 1, chloroplastic-like n=1 Tax=Olea europaea var. sylvestris TaxID=158386 RepID=UPI000C1D7521|nr:sigma factor binding protein 1, chloroplastic-like [Olea europaea var. sylvestris]